MDLYEATGGDHWDNNKGWGEGAPSSSWYGVEVNSEGRVVRLDLQANNLRGELTVLLGNLTELTYLNVKQNHLAGEIPASITEARNLIIVSLGWNKLSGELPADMDKWTNMRLLRLTSNRFSGAIPSKLPNNDKLKWLYFQNNEFTSADQPVLGKLSSKRLEIVDIRGNRLSYEDHIQPTVAPLSHIDFKYGNQTAP